MPIRNPTRDRPNIISFTAPVEFPSSVSPLFWMDARSSSEAFSDAAGTIPAVAPNGLVRRINEVSPLTANWQAINDASRPRRDTNALRFEPANPALDHILQNSGSATGINGNDSTFVASWVARDGFGGLGWGIIQGTSAPSWGIFGLGEALAVFFNGSYVPLGSMVAPRGAHMTIGVRWTPTGVNARLLTNGALGAVVDIPATVTGGVTTNLFNVANNGTTQTSLYASVLQEIGVNRAVTDLELEAMMAWSDAIPAPAAYPVEKPLIGIVGDSIAAGSSVQPYYSWGYTMLRNLRASKDPEVCNVAVSGQGVGTAPYSNAAYNRVIPFYNAARVKNVLVIALCTNDLAAGSSAASAIAGYWEMCDTAQAAGWKVVACTILPRSASIVTSQGTFNTARATFDAAIIADWVHHADALANVAAVPGMGADGDSDNATNYADKIHPTAVGFALIEPTYRAAVLSLL